MCSCNPLYAWPVQGQRQAGSVTVVHKPRKGAPAAAPLPQRPERAVVNCLCCGKVFRTRSESPDVLRFLGTLTRCACHTFNPLLHACVIQAAAVQCLVSDRGERAGPDACRDEGHMFIYGSSLKPSHQRGAACGRKSWAALVCLSLLASFQMPLRVAPSAACCTQIARRHMLCRASKISEPHTNLRVLRVAGRAGRHVHVLLRQDRARARRAQ